MIHLDSDDIYELKGFALTAVIALIMFFVYVIFMWTAVHLIYEG